MNRYLSAFLIGIGLATLPMYGQTKSVPCTLKFSIAQRDALGNVDLELNSDDQKWLEKKVLKHYPGICYADQKANEGIWFYIVVSTQTQEAATATTNTYPNGDGSTTSHTRITPQTTTYPVYTLKIGRFHDGNLEVLRTFQRTKGASSGGGGAVGGVVGLLSSLGNPEHDVIQDAIDWISLNGVSEAPPTPAH